MKAGTRRALIRLLYFLCLTIVFAIIYGVIIGCVEYFFGYWAGLAVRVATIALLVVCLGYLMVRDENKEDEEEKK